MADKIVNDITLLFKTKLDEKSKQEVGKNLKGLLENAVIGFDEAETKRNLEPIVQMMKRLFDKAEIAFDADELLSMPSRQALEKMAKMEVNQLQMAFDKALSKSGGIKIDFDDVGLSELATPLKQIENELSDISRKIADTTKKSVYEIEQSLKSISKNKSFKKIASPEGIENTLLESASDKKIHPSKAAVQLEKARDLYETSVKEDNPWVVQYKYLLDFVSKYEKLTSHAKTKIESERPEFKQLYDMLSPKAGAVKISLEHYVDVARGNELSEYKNQPWAREKTLERVARTLENGISVKEGSGGGDNSHKNDDAPPWEDNNKDASSKKPNTKIPLGTGKSDVEKAASDAATQEQQILNQKIEETQNKIKENEKKIAEIKKDISSNKSFKMYKGIGAADAADFDDRDDVYSTYQADYYSSDIKAAASYAADEESHIVVAEIAPKDALMFDAKDYSKSGDYSEVLSSPAFIDDLKTKLKNRYTQRGMSEQKLQKKYAEIDKLEFVVGDLFDAEGNQMLVNEAAYDAGFDSVIFDNVLDFATNVVEGKAEGEGLSAKRQTGKTIAVLKDEILKIIGFHKVEETKNGQNVSEELLKEIPDYYHMPYQENEDGDLEPQSVADFSDNLKKNAELEAEIDAINKQNKKLQKELQELKGRVSAEVDSKVDNISNVEVVDTDQSVRVEADAHQQNTEAIKQEVAAEKELNDVKTQVVDTDDDAETIAKENGALADKLELLRDIAEQYGNNITQKTRNRYEELNQKDMNDGLTEKEEERFSELGDQIIEADEALEEFEKTYDKIVLKLANGKKVEILPDDKGLRSLYNFADGYGEEYNGVEIDDVIYQRVQKEAVAHQENTAAIATEVRVNEEKIKSYEELCAIIERLNSLRVKDQKSLTSEEASEVDAILAKIKATKGELSSDQAFGAAWRWNSMFTGSLPVNTEQMAQYLGIEVPQAANVAKQAVDELNNSLEKQNTIEDDKVDEITAKKAETDAINQQNEALKENIDLKAKANTQDDDIVVDADVGIDTTKPSTGDTEIKAFIDTEELRSLLNSITYNVKVVQDVEPSEGNKVSINADELRSVLDGITYNVKLAQGESDNGSNKIAIDEGILENVLNRITYDVKIAHDDADKTANKIAIDESALESTLNRVFGSILSPKDDGKKPERKKEPWALEKTLNTTIKGVLDQIQTNTAKPESIEVAPAQTDVGNVLATENTLMAIKTAVEAINKKVVKGTKAKTSESGGKKTSVGKKNAESYDNSRYFPEKLKTQTMQLAKFRAQLMTTGKLTDDVDAQIYELLEGLKQVQNGPDFSAWMQKFQQLKTSVGITDIFEKADDKEVAASYEQLIEFQKIRNKLELQYAKAQDGSALKQFYAEQLAQMDVIIAKQEEMLENEEYEAKLAKIQEEQARKLSEIEAKAVDKDAKKRAAAAKKLAQREAMLGKTGSAVGRAESTWVSAVGIEGDLPASFTTEVDTYYQKLDALRKKHQELKNSDMISEEQKKELIAQTMEINKMTSEIGELVAEYQRLSGDNAKVIGVNALGTDAGIRAYEQQLKQAVMTATNGKAQIKSFDAATQTLTYTVKTGKNEFTEYTAAVRRADGALVSVQGTTKRTETFLEATKRKIKEISSYISGMSLISRLGQELRRGIQYVRDIDLALTELKKVTDETEESYDRFLETAAKTADKVGSTIQKVVSSTADWARLNI